MNDSFDRVPSSEPTSGPLLSSPLRRWVFAAYAALLAVAGVWLLATRSPAAEASAPPGVRIGVLGGPESVVLELVKTKHPELGLELVPYDDPARINEDVARGTLDAASFQDGVSLESDIARRGLPLAQVAVTVTLPLGLYSKSLRRLDELKPGSRVALSTDPVAQARALLVLYHYGLIGIARDPAPDLRISDVTKNPRELSLQAVPPQRLTSELASSALVALEYADATSEKLEPARHALGLEDAFTPFAQVLTVRVSDRAAPPPWLPALLSAYREREVKELILRRFDDSVRRPW